MRGVAYILPDPEAGELTRELASLLAALKAIGPQRQSLDHREYSFIQAARALGATWDQIAAALGCKDTTQRYAELRERFASPDLDGT